MTNFIDGPQTEKELKTTHLFDTTSVLTPFYAVRKRFVTRNNVVIKKEIEQEAKEPP